MGLFDDVMKKVGAAPAVAPATESSQPTLISAVLSLLVNRSGGISGLVQQFADHGLGNLVNSWISTGQNLPISADEVQRVLGSDSVKQIAEHAGIPPEAAQSSLAQVLPQVIDHLTPDGKIPQGDLMSNALESLKGKFFS